MEWIISLSYTKYSVNLNWYIKYFIENYDILILFILYSKNTKTPAAKSTFKMDAKSKVTGVVQELKK